MSSFYRKLMNTDEIPSSLKKYISTIDNLKIRVAEKGIPIEQVVSDIFWITDNLTPNNISLLCGYLSESGIIEFNGEYQYIRICPDQPGEAKTIASICDKIHDLLSLAGGFRGDYRGVVLIDLSSLKHFNRDFIEVMRYIKVNTAGCFRIVTGNIREYQIAEVERILCAASYRAKTIRNDSLTPDKAMIFFEMKLEECGFTFDNKTRNVIYIMLRQLTESHKINTLTDVSGMCDDVLFFLLCEGCDGIVTVNMIDAYFRQCILYAADTKEKRHMGFLSSREK